MNTSRTHLDVLGQSVGPNDAVEICEIPDELIQGLPKEDQDAILAQTGKRLVVVKFNQHGYAEIEFTDFESNSHTVWIKPDHLKKL